jgi:hypothetical protein
MKVKERADRRSAFMGVERLGARFGAWPRTFLGKNEYPVSAQVAICTICSNHSHGHGFGSIDRELEALRTWSKPGPNEVPNGLTFPTNGGRGRG